jgi:hypothetical protein
VHSGNRGNNRIHVCPTKNRPVFGPGSSFDEPQDRRDNVNQLFLLSILFDVDPVWLLCRSHGCRLGGQQGNGADVEGRPAACNATRGIMSASVQLGTPLTRNYSRNPGVIRPYSSRSTCMGSTREARIAGTNAANAATRSMRRTTVDKVTISKAETP